MGLVNDLHNSRSNEMEDRVGDLPIFAGSVRLSDFNNRAHSIAGHEEQSPSTHNNRIDVAKLVEKII